MDGQLVELGPIVRLQVQTGSLKTGVKPNRIYDPHTLRSVPALTLTAEGVTYRENGQVLLDVHHAHHPHSKQTETGENAISIGFTRHYEAIRQQFGHPTPLGCGGENIIVSVDEMINPARVVRGLVIGRADGLLISLTGVLVAAPCRPFAGYLFGRTVSADELKAGVQFLDAGMRGYYARLDRHTAATIELGDPVYAL